MIDLLAVSWGGGSNSTAMLVGLHERGIRPDVILFADTGGEKPHTYQFISAFSKWLESVRFPAIQVVSYDFLDKKKRTLEELCLEKEMLPSLAYGYKKCSQKFKRAPQDKFMNNHAPAKEVWRSGRKVTKAIGFEWGEERRAKIHEDKKYNYWYPLMEWRWDRDECVEAIQRAGLPLPGKSACYFCPASRKDEIKWLYQNEPDLFIRAIEIERNAQLTLTSSRGLGRRFSWFEYIVKAIEMGEVSRDSKIQAYLDSVRCQFPEPQQTYFVGMYDGIPCGCYDGGEDD